MDGYLDDHKPKNASYWKRRALKAESELENLEDSIKEDVGESIKGFLRDLSKSMSVNCATQLATYLSKSGVIKL